MLIRNEQSPDNHVRHRSRGPGRLCGSASVSGEPPRALESLRVAVMGLVTHHRPAAWIPVATCSSGETSTDTARKGTLCDLFNFSLPPSRITGSREPFKLQTEFRYGRSSTSLTTFFFVISMKHCQTKPYCSFIGKG